MLRRNGVTRSFLEKAQSTDGIARKVLIMYDKVRSETRNGDKESMDRVRSEIQAWNFEEEKDLSDMDRDTKSEIKAVIRAMKELLRS